jgi:integrase
MPTARKTKSGNWRCQAFDRVEVLPDGKKKYHHRSFTARTKYETERLAAEYMANKNRPTCELQFGDALNKYFDAKSNTLSPSTLKGYKALQRTAYGHIASMRLDKITSEDAQVCINLYAADHSAKSCRNALGLLTAVINTFLPDTTIHVTLPQPKAVDYYTPSDEDIKKLMTELKNEELKRAVLLSAFGTLRRSEVCGLKDTDIDGNTITVRRAKVESESGWVVKDFPKNDTSNRTIIYPDFVIQAVSGREGFLVRMTPKRLDVAFQRARKRAGLPYFRFHDLRAYSVSIAHAIGIPDAYLMQRGGWKTDSTFKKIYRRAISDKNRELSAKLNAHFEKLHS